jgi:hypothetical protein
MMHFKEKEKRTEVEHFRCEDQSRGSGTFRGLTPPQPLDFPLHSTAIFSNGCPTDILSTIYRFSSTDICENIELSAYRTAEVCREWMLSQSHSHLLWGRCDLSSIG